jgi:predicted RNA-binding Zn ribbon-like protein
VQAVHRGPAALQLGSDGSIRHQPQEAGQRALVMLVLGALFEAQQAGTSRRLKACRDPRCRVAVYDRSRNASGLRHSARIATTQSICAPTETPAH